MKLSLFFKNVKHSLEETQEFKRIADQYKWRKEIILNTLKENNIDLKRLNTLLVEVDWLKTFHREFIKSTKR